VKSLEVAWTHFPERATRGIQSTPLAADGVLYYSGSYSRVYALDGASSLQPRSRRSKPPARLEAAFAELMS
jgi:glucose dehydrogenase